MIKPFTIVSQEPRDGGTGVKFRVNRRFMASGGQRTEELESYCLVPSGNDVDAYVYEYLKNSGWVD